MENEADMEDMDDAREEELPDIDELPSMLPVDLPPVSLIIKDRDRMKPRDGRAHLGFKDGIAGSSSSFSVHRERERVNDKSGLGNHGNAKCIKNPDISSKSSAFSSKGKGHSGGKKFPAIPVVGVKDNDGFLAPPPASTLLIRRTRTSSTGSSTYIVSPSVPNSSSNDEPPVKRRMSSSDRESFKRPIRPERRASLESNSMDLNGTPVPKRKSSYSKNIAKITKGIKGSRPLHNKHILKLKEKLKVKRPSNIDPATGKRRYKKRNSKLSFPMHQKQSLVGETDFPDPETEDIEYEPVTSMTWRPIDDFRLLVNALQTNDLKQVHMGVKFSCRYTLEEIKKRWRTLMYGEKLSKVALTACRNIHSKVKWRVYAEALFSEAEIKKLQTIKSTSNPSLSVFNTMLREDVLTFNKARTAKSLYKCWMDLKELQMLDDQNIKKYFERGSENFSDFESSVNDKDLRNLNVDPAVMQEVLLMERQNKKRIRILEQEIATWQDLADLVWEGQIVKAPEFDDNTYALIRGKNVRFAMAAKEITLGRRTEDNWVDADLSEEGCDYKVSRRQATIKMRALGDFVILNQGKHSMYIDGHAVHPGEVAPLRDQSVIKVSELNFVFIVNDKLLQELYKKIVEEESNAEHVDFNCFKHLQSTSDDSTFTATKEASGKPQSSVPGHAGLDQNQIQGQGTVGVTGSSNDLDSTATPSPKSKSPRSRSTATSGAQKRSKSKPKSEPPNPSTFPTVDLILTSPGKSKGADKDKDKDKGQAALPVKKPPKKNRAPRVKKPKAEAIKQSQPVPVPPPPTTLEDVPAFSTPSPTTPMIPPVPVSVPILPLSVITPMPVPMSAPISTQASGPMPIPASGPVPIPASGPMPIPVSGQMPVPVSVSVPLSGLVPVPLSGPMQVSAPGPMPVPVSASFSVPLSKPIPMPVSMPIPVPVSASTSLPTSVQAPIPESVSIPVPVPTSSSQ